MLSFINVNAIPSFTTPPVYWDWISSLSLLVWWGILIRLRSAMRKIPDIAEEKMDDRRDLQLPPVYVVVPARNEAENIEKSIHSLLVLDYPDLHVIAVDDRSTDGTGKILTKLAREDSRLHVAHVETLPDGWLGKNHACFRAAEEIRRMTGSLSSDRVWILFSDGDIVHERDSLMRSLHLAMRTEAEHLALLPDFIANGILERSYTGAFGLFFLLGMRVWEVSDPGSTAFIGIGAYNLVRLDRYVMAGGHAAIPFDVVDDIKLGMLLKRTGARQILADSGGRVRVRWQRGFRATIRGLMKNFFAGYDYRWSLVFVATFSLLFLGLSPLAGILFANSGWGKGAGLLASGAAALVHGRAASRRSVRWIWTGFLFPFIELTLAGTVFASALLATLRGGIEWRGTRYALKDLRRMCVKRSS